MPSHHFSDITLLPHCSREIKKKLDLKLIERGFAKLNFKSK